MAGRNEVDDDVRWLGTGYASTLPGRSRKKKNQIGFLAVWEKPRPKPTPKPQKKQKKKR